MDLAHCQSLNLQCIEKIITNCVQLTEVNFDNTDLTESALNFICNNISPTILKLSLQELKVNDENISILVKRCPKITELALIGTNISDMGVSAIQENLSKTLVSIGLPNEISANKSIKLYQIHAKCSKNCGGLEQGLYSCAKHMNDRGHR